MGCGVPQAGQAVPAWGMFSQNPATYGRAALNAAVNSALVTCCPLGFVLIPASTTTRELAFLACAAACSTKDAYLARSSSAPCAWISTTFAYLAAEAARPSLM